MLVIIAELNIFDLHESFCATCMSFVTAAGVDSTTELTATVRSLVIHPELPSPSIPNTPLLTIIMTVLIMMMMVLVITMVFTMVMQIDNRMIKTDYDRNTIILIITLRYLRNRFLAYFLLE